VARKGIPYSRKDLHRRGPQPSYRGRRLDHIAFPLGGIGTGMVSLGGWGQLRDWEIRNRPAKGFTVPDSFVTLKVRQQGAEPITKVVQGPAGGDHIGGGGSMPRQSGEGLPHFRKVTFKGHFPFATVRFRDPDVPVRVTLEAFNPFIPLNADDSGIPVAIFLYKLRNVSSKPVSATLYANLTNVVGHPDPEGRVNEAREGLGMTGLYLTTSKHPRTSPRFGSMALVTTWEEAAVWPRWIGGHGTVGKFWEAVAWGDEFPPPAGELPTGTVAAHVELPANSEETIPFLITWHFPVFEHWRASHCEDGCERAATWRNYYATVWDDAWDVAEYVVSHYDRLYDETRRFHDSLFASTVPAHVLDAVSSQLSILKSPTCLRLEDGTLYGFEGCNDTSGCCEGSCTHVWNYAQALPYLFPSLQRSMLDAHLTYSMADDGFIQFRMPLPLGTEAKAGFLPAADGQNGLVMQAYREWLVCGDRVWLARVWPKVKLALEFAWKYWDADRDGVMEGVQHNTYDQEWWGPNTMTGSLYLGALRAGEELALAVGDTKAAAVYRKLFEKGSAWTDRHLFNGEYYEQQVNPKANDLWPEPYHGTNDRGRDDRFPDWPRWQFGQGCLSDQLIGQWVAAMLGLGYLYDKRNVRKALRAIVRHNWRADLSDHPCTLRIYAVNDEAGLLIASWPHGGRPGYPFWFADEVWCGIEYQVASHLRGDRRNPWDEFECGHHYARSLASYGLLLALSGFRYSAPEQSVGFAPRLNAQDFRCFFGVDAAWGLYTQKVGEAKTELTLRVDYGDLPLARVVTPLIKRKATAVRAVLSGQERGLALRRDTGGYAVVFDRPLVVGRGQILRITIE